MSEELGSDVEHPVRGWLGNPIEQSHREIKQRDDPRLGFEAIKSTKQFCQALVISRASCAVAPTSAGHKKKH
jgi:transposase-like protein